MAEHGCSISATTELPLELPLEVPLELPLLETPLPALQGDSLFNSATVSSAVQQSCVDKPSRTKAKAGKKGARSRPRTFQEEGQTPSPKPIPPLRNTRVFKTKYNLEDLLERRKQLHEQCGGRFDKETSKEAKRIAAAISRIRSKLPLFEAIQQMHTLEDLIVRLQAEKAALLEETQSLQRALYQTNVELQKRDETIHELNNTLNIDFDL